MGKGSSNRMPSAARKAMKRNEEREQATYDYLFGQEQLPSQLRQGAQAQLGGLYGLEGGTGSQQQLIDQARNSPLYGAMMTQGSDAIAANASMSGGLRSGNFQSNMADFSANTLLQSYNQQLRGLEGVAQMQPMGSMLSARLGPTNIPGSMQQQSTQGAWMGGLQQMAGSGGAMSAGGAFG